MDFNHQLDDDFLSNAFFAQGVGLDEANDFDEANGVNGNEDSLDGEIPQRFQNSTPAPLEFVEGLRIRTNHRHRKIIESIKDALQNSTNLLVEAPVNSERRLSTLYATLAYRHQLNEYGHSVVVPNKKSTRANKIYYGVNRFEEVHEVLEQLGKLGGTDFLKNVTLAVLGSRKHLCLKETGERSCYCQNSRRLGTHCQFEFIERASGTDSDQVHSIEDFKQNCRETTCCPYWESQHLLENADFIICPQNFILSPLRRQKYKINLSNVILILDDGYDMEKLCDNEASITISTRQLLQASRKLEADFANPLQPRSSNIQQNDDIISNLATSLTSLCEWINEHNEEQVTSEQFLTALQLNGLRIQMEEVTYQTLNTTLETLLNSCAHPDFTLIQKIRKFLSILKIISGNNQRNINYFYIDVITCPNNSRDLALKIICTNPALIFRPVADHTQSVIIASSCLAPVSTFQTELGVDFETLLEIDTHDVSEGDYAIAYCSFGPQPQKVELNLRGGPRKNPAIQKAVGDALVKLCEEIPNGVVVLFQSQHTMLYPMKRKWEEQPNALTPSIMTRLTQEKKVFCEMNHSDADLPAMFEEYRRSSRSEQGAVLLVMVRGKLLDNIRTLKGEELRAIVHVGVPFGDWYSDDLLMAKKYISDVAKTPVAKSEMKEWNNKDAFRIMNQSFALCVQDPEEGRMMIVLDSRVKQNKEEFHKLLPAWTRSNFRYCHNFSDLFTLLD